MTSRDTSDKLNPVRAPLMKHPDRLVLCRHYEACLDVAAAGNWEGWSCSGCKDYEVLEYDLEQWTADALACLALAFTIHKAAPSESFNFNKGRLVKFLETEARLDQYPHD